MPFFGFWWACPHFSKAPFFRGHVRCNFLFICPSQFKPGRNFCFALNFNLCCGVCVFPHKNAISRSRPLPLSPCSPDLLSLLLLLQLPPRGQRVVSEGRGRAATPSLLQLSLLFYNCLFCCLLNTFVYTFLPGQSPPFCPHPTIGWGLAQACLHILCHVRAAKI